MRAPLWVPETGGQEPKTAENLQLPDLFGMLSENDMYWRGASSNQGEVRQVKETLWDA